MTDKEWLEEIKKLRETILEENDFRTRCVLASVFVCLGYMDYLIKQVERVQELEQQNKNYRKAIKECIERMNEGGAGTRSFVYEKLIEVLEGEE